jgi:hypothetical protein
MIAVLLAGILGIGSSPSPAPPSCHGGDISVTDLRIKLIKGSSKTTAADRLLITGDFTNVGTHTQEPNVHQHAELLRDGNVVATQPLPPLDAGVTYPLQFRIFRDTSQRTDPLQVLVRYVLDDKHHVVKDNCLLTNDSLTKMF